MISVIIPARKEPYLNRTIKNLYENAVGDIEVIVVLDGEKSHVDSRARVIYHSEPQGRRIGMNEAAAVAKGEYLFHVDAHCSMTKAWDEKLKESCLDNALVVSIISSLDEETWKIKPGHSYTFVSLDKSLVEHWWGKYKKLEDCDITEETMAFTGCGWMIRKDYYWAVGGCDESLGQLCHLGPEWALKVWLHPKHPGRVILRTDVICGHVFATSSKKIQNYHPQRISDIEFCGRMRADYGKGIEILRKKFNPPHWDDDVTTEVKQTIKVAKKEGLVDVIEIDKEYFPVERPKDSTITYTDWRLLWQIICERMVKSVVEFGPGLSTEILDRCGIRITSYETKPALLDSYKKKVPGAKFVLWNGGQLINLNGKYDMAFIDGPFGGENRELAYKSIARSGVRLVACHDSNRKADKVWIKKYFGNWNKVAENPLKTGLLILER